jgi:hypothetical protein
MDGKERLSYHKREKYFLGACIVLIVDCFPVEI